MRIKARNPNCWLGISVPAPKMSHSKWYGTFMGVTGKGTEDFLGVDFASLLAN